MKPDQSGVTWLELARRQSQIAARARAEQVVPFNWDAVDKAPHAGAARYRWLLLLLPAVLAVGTTATWAFVRHLKQRKSSGANAPPAQLVAPTVQRAPQRVRLKPRILPEVAPEARPQQPARRDAVLRPKRVAAPVAKTPVSKRPVLKRPISKTPVSKTPVSKTPARINADDEVIIVVPPAKMKPLWNVETLRR